MTKKQTELSEELREAVFEAARAGAAEAYTQNTGYVNYFKAMETLLYNYKKLAALVADEEAYCEVEYHAGRKTFSTTPQAKGFIQRKTISIHAPARGGDLLLLIAEPSFAMKKRRGSPRRRWRYSA